MKPWVSGAICSLILSVCGLAQAQNLLTNPGFDDSTASVTLAGAPPPGPNIECDNEATLPGWQMCVVSEGASATWSAEESIDAISPPNVLNFSKESSPGDAVIRNEISRAPVTELHVYKSSFWFQGDPVDVEQANAFFNADPGFIGRSGDVIIPATSDWQRSEASWLPIVGAVDVSFQLRLIAGDAAMTFDSVALEDVTDSNRMTNPSFENSDTQLINWGIVDFNGRGFGAEIANDASDGSNAARLFQTAATTEGSDGVLAKDTGGYYLPWLGGNLLTVSVDIKDDPNLDSNEDVNVSVVAFDAGKAFIGVANQGTFRATSVYETHEVLVDNMPPATAFISINFRISNGGGTDPDNDDVLVDNVVVLDTGVPPAEPPVGLSCSRTGDGSTATLSWTNVGDYDDITVLRNGQEVASLEGSADSYQDMAVPPEAVLYEIVAEAGGSSLVPGPTCKVLNPSSTNLISNPGFDFEADSVTLGDGEATQFDSTTFTDWQVVALGNSPANATFTTQPDVEAISPPNVMIFQKSGGPGEAVLRNEVVRVSVEPGNVYRVSYWLRGSPVGVNHFTGVFDGAPNFLGPFGDINVNATADWQLSESTFLAPGNAVSASAQFRLNAPDATVQLDAIRFEDITDENRMTNGSFENSATQLINWGIVDFNGRGFGAEIVNDASHGSQAARLFQTAAQTAGSDGVLAKDSGGFYVPWKGSNRMRVALSIKDSPTFDTDEDVNVSVIAFDDAKAFIEVSASETFRTTSDYERHEISATTLPAATTFISINFRISHGGGTDADQDDVLVDDVVVIDESELVVESPSGLICTRGPDNTSVNLVWRNNGIYDLLKVFRDDAEIADLDPSSISYLDVAAPLATATYEVRADFAGPLPNPPSCAIGLPETPNLLGNPGWDESTATITLGSALGQAFDNEQTFPSWQVFAVDNPPGNATFSSEPSADAISPPNVVVFTKTGGPRDAGIRDEIVQVPVEQDRIYKTSFYFRGDLAASVNHFAGNFGTTGFLGAAGDTNFTPTSRWQKAESTWVPLLDAVTVSLQLRLSLGDTTMTFDNMGFEDITELNHMTNPSFENSGSQPFNWGVVDFNGRGFGAEIVQDDAAEGNQSVRLFQTAAETAGSDGVFAKDAGNFHVAWLGDHVMQVALSIKDSPIFDTSEDVQVQVVAFDAGRVFIEVVAVETFRVTDEWVRHEFTADDPPPNTAFFTLNFRISNGAGTDPDRDDVLVDDIVICDDEFEGRGRCCTDEVCDMTLGACCTAAGDCDLTTEADCIAGGGEYRGDGTICATVACAAIGACCTGENCDIQTETDCVAGGGEYQGDETTCETGTCTATGACCTGENCDIQTEADCLAGGGSYLGGDTTCATVICQVGTPFRRGDHDGSGAYDLTDALNLLSELFLGTFETKCENASDFDNSGARDISDALNGLGHLFLGTVGIPPPGPGVCGLDTTEVIPAGTTQGIIVDQPVVDLGCDEYPNPDFLPNAACP